MSVAFATEVIRRLRARGVVVSDNWTDWRRNGNGQTSAYAGGIMHHTATAYGDAFPALVAGRPDLSGPLCNSAGCADGSITIVAAHPANHAGASGGRGTRPFPATRVFNRMVWGHEIVYPGTSPMTDAQWHSMVQLGAVICEILNRGPEWIKGHYETSVTGKWDPGFAPPDRSISMNDVRAQIHAALEDDMFTPTDRQFLDDIKEQLTGSREPGQFPGFPSFVDPTVKLSDVDFLRRIDQRMNTLLSHSNAQEEALRDLTQAVSEQHGIDGDQLLSAITTAINEELERASLGSTKSPRPEQPA